MIKDKDLLALLDIVEHGPLALPPPPASSKREALGAPAATTTTTAFDAAGLAFERRWRVAHGVQPDPEEEEDDAGAGAGGSAESAEEAARWEGFNERKVDESDWYALLNLDHLQYHATYEEITRAYKRAAIATHPDKTEPSRRPAAESRFKAMQLAYHVLSNPAARRGYDSSLDFDDDVPGPKEGTGDSFYEVFGPVFERNSRFSQNQPVPQLGGPDTPYAEVDHFYDFWFSFSSWREFAHLNEHKVEHASSRDEKRFMQRENKKKQAAAMKKESARLRRLVDDAMSKDPRVAAQQQKEKEAKKARKKARATQRGRGRGGPSAEEVAAERKKAAEEKAAAEAAAAEEAKKKKASKANAKVWRKVVRHAVRRKTFVDWPEEDLEALVAGVSTETLERVASAVCADFSKRDAPVEPERVESGRAVLEEVLAEVKK